MSAGRSSSLNEARFIQAIETLYHEWPAAEYVDLSPGRALLIPGWLSATEGDALMADCLKALQWDSPSIRLFGRSFPIPRRHAFVGDPGVYYRWSGLKLPASPWPEGLNRVRSHLKSSGFDFNSALLNHYRGGSDSMGWHADDERELGENPVVATISLGQMRPLVFRRKDGSARVAVELESGALLLTSGAVQHSWKHQVAKTRREVGERVSLTFRNILFCP